MLEEVHCLDNVVFPICIAILERGELVCYPYWGVGDADLKEDSSDNIAPAENRLWNIQESLIRYVSSNLPILQVKPVESEHGGTVLDWGLHGWLDKKSQWFVLHENRGFHSLTTHSLKLDSTKDCIGVEIWHFWYSSSRQHSHDGINGHFGLCS